MTGPRLSSVVVWAIVGGVVSSVTVRTGTTVAADLTVRDCLKGMPDSSQPVATVETVPCGESHAGEVFAVLNMPGGDFPGEAAIEAYADNCGPAFVSYSPKTTTDDSIQLSVLYPTADSWKQGDRALICIARLDPPRAGSLKG